MKMKFAILAAFLITTQPVLAQSKISPSKINDVKLSQPVYQRVDINQASFVQLTNIKGLGKVKAKAIIDYRKEHGKFSSLDELTQVKGIGKKALKKLKPRLKV